jgi:HTH-type transcriptional regulator/antitoxin HigA
MRHPMDTPDPIEAIRFRLEQQGLEPRVLVGVIGSRTRVYEVLRGARPLTLAMIRRLHEQFGIPAEVLIQPVGKKRRAA